MRCDVVQKIHSSEFTLSASSLLINLLLRLRVGHNSDTTLNVASRMPRLTPDLMVSATRTLESPPLHLHHVLAESDDGLWHLQIRRDDNGNDSWWVVMHDDVFRSAERALR